MGRHKLPQTFGCMRCQRRFLKLETFEAHVPHCDSGKVFLDKPEAIESLEPKTYAQLLQESTKRFSVYKRYIGHGDDYYDLKGTIMAANRLATTSKHREIMQIDD